jgi:hypothetical protein
LALVHLGIAQSLLDRIHGVAEEIGAQLLETGTSDVGVEVNAVEERVDFDGSLNFSFEATALDLI